MKGLSDKEILSVRAKSYANPVEFETSSAETFEVLEFTLEAERYAIDVSFVREVYSFQDYTKLPCCPPHIFGITNIRGQIVSLIDLKRLFELPSASTGAFSQAIIINTNGIELGIVIDEILNLRALDRLKIQPGLPTLVGSRAEYLVGIAEDQLIVLDAEKILLGNRKK